MASPLDAGASDERPRFAWRWAVATGPAFVLLFLFATGSLGRVEADLSRDATVPSFRLDSSNGWTFQSPWLTVVLSDHLLLGISWAVAAFLAVAGVLVAVNAGLNRRARTVCARLPAAGRRGRRRRACLLRRPDCCGGGLPVGFALGGGTLTPVLWATPWLLLATPWLLLATACLLAGNLFLLRRRWRAAQAPAGTA